MISDTEASALVDAILRGTKPLSELSALTQQQLEKEIGILQRVVGGPRGGYPAELVRAYNEGRIAYLRGAAERPGSLLEFAEQWLARQSPEWARANSATAERIAAQAARAREMATRRAAAAAAEEASSWSSRFGGVLRFLASPFVWAATEILVDPTPTAGPGGVGVDQLMRPPHSPEIYYLPRGTYVLPNGLIYSPSPNSAFRPPAGSVRVTGSVSGQDVLYRLDRTLKCEQVQPVK